MNVDQISAGSSFANLVSWMHQQTQETRHRQTLRSRMAIFAKRFWSSLVLFGLPSAPFSSFLLGPEWQARVYLIRASFRSSPSLDFSDPERARAVARGLHYIYRTSLSRSNFTAYAGDYLWCFYTLAVAARDEPLKQMARRMGVGTKLPKARKALSVTAVSIVCLNFMPMPS
jgi:hypothetical protein